MAHIIHYASIWSIKYTSLHSQEANSWLDAGATLKPTLNKYTNKDREDNNFRDDIAADACTFVS